MTHQWRILSLLFLAAGSDGATFDFESINPSPGGSGTYHSLTLSSGGVTLTLTRLNNTGFDVSDNTQFPDLGVTAPNSWRDRSLSGALVVPSANSFLGDFDQVQSHISVEFGDFGFDEDSLILTGYSGSGGSGQILATRTANYSAQSTLPGDVGVLSIDAAGIRSFTLGSLASDTIQNSLYFDNITTTVPEPSLAAIGLGAALCILRRRRFCRLVENATTDRSVG